MKKIIEKFNSLTKNQRIAITSIAILLVLTFIGAVVSDNSSFAEDKQQVGSVYVYNTIRTRNSDGTYNHQHTMMVLGYDDDLIGSNNPTFTISYTSASQYSYLLDEAEAYVYVYEDGTMEFISMDGYTEVGRIHFDNVIWYDNWDDTIRYLN